MLQEVIGTGDGLNGDSSGANKPPKCFYSAFIAGCGHPEIIVKVASGVCELIWSPLNAIVRLLPPNFGFQVHAMCILLSIDKTSYGLLAWRLTLGRLARWLVGSLGVQVLYIS